MNAPFNPRAALAVETPAPVAVTGHVERHATPSRSAQDWEQLVSPGHVWGHRIRRAGIVAFVAALPFAAVAGMTVFGFATGRGPDILAALPIPTISVPAFVDQALTYDPNTYTDLGGGRRASYRLKWLADLPKSRGLSEDAWKSLNSAVAADLSTGLDTNRWSATPALAVAPKVTRPERALSEHVARLDTGIVTVPTPAQAQRVHVVAMVNGALAWTWFDNMGCRTFGPISIPNCLSGPLVESVANNLRPTPSK